jgi:CRISPR-associated protein Cas6
MFWNEQSTTKDQFVVPDDIVDIVYKLDCKSLPLDHAWPLSHALQQALPWLAAEEHAGVHLIHMAESGNGWYRPDDPENDQLYLSKRTRLTLRIPKPRIADALQLTGTILDVAGSALTVQAGAIKLLSTLPTLFARYVTCDATQDETAFLQTLAAQLRTMGIPVTKLLAGKQNTLRLPHGPVATRSLMVADLIPAQSVRLQQQGLGAGRKYGCGLFVPQKGIKPVVSDND